MNLTIAKLLQYSFEGVDWEFDRLTKTEREIIGDQDALNEIKRIVSLFDINDEDDIHA